MRKVKCIDADGHADWLTHGKTYDVVREDDMHYFIDADKCAEFGFYKHRFLVVWDTDAPAQEKQTIYIGGSLANPEIVRVTKALIDAGHDAFSEWYTPGPEADVLWRDYELALGFDYRQALQRPSAKNTFDFDKRHIDLCEVFVMVLPCGKSAHLELGYAIGKGKRGIIYMPQQPERWDVMYGFAERVVYTEAELLEAL